MWTVLIAVVLTSVGWVWYGVKREATMRATYRTQIELLERHNRELLKTVDVMVDATDIMRQGYEASAKDALTMRRELDELKRMDGISRAYLKRPVPDGVQSVLKNSRCLQMPGSCLPDKPHSSGVPGDTHE